MKLNKNFFLRLVQYPSNIWNMYYEYDRDPRWKKSRLETLFFCAKYIAKGLWFN